MFREQRFDGNQTGFDDDGPGDGEIGAWRQPLGSVSVQMLPLGCDRVAVNRLYGGNLRSGRNPKTSRQTECQRANGDENQDTTPSALTNSRMYQQLHVAVSAKPHFLRLYNTDNAAKHHFGNEPPKSSWIPNPESWLHERILLGTRMLLRQRHTGHS